MDTRQAQVLAVGMMHTHGLRGWTFGWDNAKNRIGACHYRKRMITLSSALVPTMTEDQVQQAMLHEIAHVLTPATEREHHGPKWLATARSIGYRGGRTLDVPSAPYRYVGTCANGHTFKRHRRPAAGKNLRCVACVKAAPRNIMAGLIVWKDTETGREFRTYTTNPTLNRPAAVAAVQRQEVRPRPRSTRGGETYNGRGKFDKGFTDIESLFGDE